MKIVTVEQMREIERSSIFERGISGELLMDNAGVAVAKFVKKFIKKNKLEKKVLVFAGKGNNGGDAFVAAGYLLRKKMQVTVIVLAKREMIKGDALLHLKKLEMVLPQIIFEPCEAVIKQELATDYSLVVDGLLGTGVSGEVTGVLRETIQLINKSNLPIVSIDIPSGLDADRGVVLGEAVAATATVTMGLLKMGLVKQEGLNYVGRIVVADIGFPSDLLEGVQGDFSLLAEDKVKNCLLPRKRISHKGNYGKILVLAGARGFTGAASLTCQAAFRSGAGLVTLAIAEELNVILEQKLTETITFPLAGTKDGSLALEAFEPLFLKMKASNVLVIGPGISRNEETAELVRHLVSQSTIPVVLDADGINAFKGYTRFLKELKVPLIMTPHTGEFANLLNISVEELESDRLAKTLDFVKETKVIVVLKGAATLVVVPDQEPLVNLNGNAGMATAGAGDVLTGIIAGLLGGKLTAGEAGMAGVFIHGLAGDIAKNQKGESALMASDILDAIALSLKQLSPAYII